MSARRSTRPARWLASESGHIEAESGEHDLHCFEALRRMDEILVNNFHVFDDVVREGHYDLVVGDEAWDVDHFLHENPELKRFAFAWMTDFVGMLPMPDGGEREALLTADYNAEMIEHVERFPWLRDRAIFVGNPDDIVPDTLRPRPARHPRMDRAALRLRGLHHSALDAGRRSPTARSCAALSAGRPTNGSAWSPSVAPAWADTCSAGSARRTTRRATACRDYGWWSSPGPGSTPRRCRGPSRPRSPCLRARPLPHACSASDLAVVQGGLTTTMELAARAAALPLHPVAAPLRAELPCAPPPRALRCGPRCVLCPRRRPRLVGRRDRG